MRFGVTTEELGASAVSLRADADVLGSSVAPLRGVADAANGWTCGRAHRAAQAFFDTLARVAEGSAEGLRDLGDRAASGAGQYEGVERRLLVEP